MLEEYVEYARIVKPLGSSRFQLEKLNGHSVEASLKGELRNKSKNNKIEKMDWVKIQDIGIKSNGSSFKIIERVGNDKDKNVKDLKKSGILVYKEPESNVADDDIFDNEEVDTNNEDINEDSIDDL
mgnify:CR=1 FL=1|tara:strand:+ start:512 stop:889 length:378 start_codon:yes stop_codon:yes gene_type:complete